MMNKRRQKHPQFLKLIGSPSTVNHKGYQVTVSLKAVAEAGEAILGPEPTLDFLFYFRFTPVFLSVAIMGCTHKFDYVFFIYSILHQYLEIEINGKKNQKLPFVISGLCSPPIDSEPLQYFRRATGGPYPCQKFCSFITDRLRKGCHQSWLIGSPPWCGVGS